MHHAASVLAIAIAAAVTMQHAYPQSTICEARGLERKRKNTPKTKKPLLIFLPLIPPLNAAIQIVLTFSWICPGRLFQSEAGAGTQRRQGRQRPLGRARLRAEKKKKKSSR